MEQINKLQKNVTNKRHELQNVDQLMQHINLQAIASNYKTKTSPSDPLKITKMEDRSTPPNTIDKNTNLLHNNTNSSNDTNMASMSHRPPRHSRRKSSHQVVRANPDIQFETIVLEQNEESSDENMSTESEYTDEETTENTLLDKKSTGVEVFNNGFENFLNSHETLSIVKEIAAERLRINTLLTLNGMPEMSFPLYAPIESLEMELEERCRALENDNRDGERRSSSDE